MPRKKEISRTVTWLSEEIIPEQKSCISFKYYEYVTLIVFLLKFSNNMFVKTSYFVVGSSSLRTLWVKLVILS